MRHELTYERLILAVDEVAPDLEGIAYKLLWRLIAIAISRGTPAVETSVRELARGLKASKEGTARAIRELAQFITVTARDGGSTIFSLPPDWFPPQRTLFSDDSLGGDFHNRPGNQDTTVLFTRTPASYSPGHQRPTDQDTCPTNQDTSVPFTRTPVPLTRTQRPTDQDTDRVQPIRNAHARNRSIESEASASSEVVVLIDRAWATVEIPIGSEADAAVVSEWLYAYKCDLGPLRADSSYPDTAIVARIVTLAPLEDFKQVLRSLRERNKACGDQDAWFFTVLAQKIHHVSPELTRSRMALQKAKAQPLNDKPSLFGDQLLKRTADGMRRLG